MRFSRLLVLLTGLALGASGSLEAQVTRSPTRRKLAPRSLVATSGNYRVLILGTHVATETSDDPLQRDGKRDEIYFAALVRQFDRRDQRLLYTAVPQTNVMGDRNGYSARTQAGSASSMGGIRAGDNVPNVPDVGSLQAAPVAAGLPLLLWQGQLRDGVDVLVIMPEVWEWDGNQYDFNRWRNQPVPPPADPSIQSLVAAHQFGPFQSLAGNYEFALTPASVAGSYDRPVRYSRRQSDIFWPISGLVLTREAIEAALSPSAVGTGRPPGTIEVHLLGDRLWPSNNADGDYWLYLRVERVP